MKFSYNWICELVPVSVDAHKLAGLITTKTAESEGVHAVGAHFEGVCVARVQTVEPLEGSKNVKAVVDTGLYGMQTVVCGAQNCRPGMLTAYVPTGTAINGREIQRAVIGGVASEGMLASGAELGLNGDASGILELPETSITVGSKLVSKAPDWIIEIDNKSLTHRPDLWGHVGMAREVAAILQAPLQKIAPTTLLPSGKDGIAVQVDEPELCPRYSALVFENVSVRPSPAWLQHRLQSIGLNPINNIVDVTNYVMAELAQPMHAFDADLLNGTIRVRRAAEGEKLAALNRETYTLSTSDLVIADDRGAIAIAGVIGGLDSAISQGTSRIVLESANFRATGIRKTSSALKIRTDASMRFEKAQDPANTLPALVKAMELLQLVSPGIRIAGGLTDVVFPATLPAPILLPLEWLDSKLGKKVPAAEVVSILTRLEFEVRELEEGLLEVSVPSWRATKDVAIREDLVEEAGRMIGYESIPPMAPLSPTGIPPANELRIYLQKVRGLMTSRGFHEIYNYSFLSEEAAKRFGFEPAGLLRVLNPIAENQELMRPSLIPGVWNSIVENSRYSDEFRFFEIGREILRQDSGATERNRVVAVIYRKESDSEGLFELKGLAESLAPGLRFTPDIARVYEHPHRTASLMYQGELAGRVFEFHPSWVRGRGAVLELDCDTLLRLTAPARRYSPLQRFPSSSFDLSVLASERLPVGVIEEQISGFIVGFVASVEFVREYSGPPLPAEQKSVSFRITLAAADRTLSSQEVAEARGRIIEGMQAAGYELRV